VGGRDAVRRGQGNQRLAERVEHQHGGALGLHQVGRPTCDLRRDTLQVAERRDRLASLAQPGELSQTVLQGVEQAGVVHRQRDRAGERLHGHRRGCRERPPPLPGDGQHAKPAPPQHQRHRQAGRQAVDRDVADVVAAVDDQGSPDVAEPDRGDVSPGRLGDELGRAPQPLFEILSRRDQTRHPAEQPGGGPVALGNDCRTTHHALPDTLPGIPAGGNPRNIRRPRRASHVPS
jgi:hypothetical protein